MKKILSITGLIVAATLTLSASGSLAERDEYRSDRDKRSRHETNLFNVSGVVSGTLKGEVRIGDKKVFITRKTEIFDTAGKRLPEGYRLTSRSVHVSGIVGHYGDLRATVVIVKDRSYGSNLDAVMADPLDEQ